MIPRVAIVLAISVAALQLGALLFAAYFDGTLVMPGEAVGFLEHPGMIAIVIGDAAIFILAIQMIGELSENGSTNADPEG